MRSDIPGLPVLMGFSGRIHVAGLAIFFAGIALGLLLVFADRHGYERPISPRIVAVLLVVGMTLSGFARIGAQFGL